MRVVGRRVNKLLQPLGFQIRRAPRRVWDVGAAADNVSTLIDVGCAYGTPELYAANTEASLFLVDALGEYVPHMKSILAKRQGDYEVTALGAAGGEIEINVQLDALTRSSTLDRTALTKTNGRIEVRKVPLATLDSVVQTHHLRSPFGLKIDTEGFELEVLRGAPATLRETIFVIAETSVQRRFEKSYTLLELLTHMDASGFDVGSILTANKDANGVIRFMDVLFIRRST
jgi:FkbM family methyltransferase